MSDLDAISLELMNNALSAITDEMMITTRRAGYSNSIKYLMDFSAAVCDAEGNMVAQGVAMPHHLGAMPGAIEAVRAKYGEDLDDGDVVITNDPWEGSTHLPDIYVVKPIFFEGERVGYACHCAHHIDVGGRVPGSMSADSTSIHEEGIRIPPVRLYRRGTVDTAIVEIIERNVRLPTMLMGDLMAQVAACGIGERGIQALMGKHGREAVDAHYEALLAYAERLTRGAIEDIPDGEYRFTDYVDDDGVGDDPLALQVTLTVEGSSLAIDFTGSSPQTAGAINSVLAWTLSSVYTVIRGLLPLHTPNNSGTFRPVEVVAPEGTIVNATYPAACAARGVTGHRLDDAVFGAFAQAVPDKIPAASEGGNCSCRISGFDHRGKSFVLPDLVCGTRGGRPRSDGVEGLVNPGQNLSNTPVEAIESEFPVRVLRYGFVPDSGGAGRYRGGLALMREWQLLADDLVCQQRSDRYRHLPWGVDGGREGTPSANILNAGTDDETRLPSKFVRPMRKGDRLLYVSPGGGGHGDPLARDPAAVARDVDNEKITRQYARRHYGVVFGDDGSTPDLEATAELRAAMGKGGVAAGASHD